MSEPNSPIFDAPSAKRTRLHSVEEEEQQTITVADELMDDEQFTVDMDDAIVEAFTVDDTPITEDLINQWYIRRGLFGNFFVGRTVFQYSKISCVIEFSSGMDLYPLCDKIRGISSGFFYLVELNRVEQCDNLNVVKHSAQVYADFRDLLFSYYDLIDRQWDEGLKMNYYRLLAYVEQIRVSLSQRTVLLEAALNYRRNHFPQ